jgi:hypothetical protein
LTLVLRLPTLRSVQPVMTTQHQLPSTHLLHLKVLSQLPTRQPKLLPLFLRLLPLQELLPRLLQPLEPQPVQLQALLPVLPEQVPVPLVQLVRPVALLVHRHHRVLATRATHRTRTTRLAKSPN